MANLRFSLSGLMIAVALAAICCAALQSSTNLWASILFTITIALLLVGVLGAVYCRGEHRAFWFGVEVFGWAYLILVFGPWFSSASGQLLASNLLLHKLARQLGRESSGYPVLWDGIYYTPFVIIGHLCLALMLAGLGGVVARHFWRKQK